MRFKGRYVLVLAPILTISAWFQAGPALAAGLDAVVTATGSTTPALGIPFTYKTTITNSTATTQTFSISFALVQTASAASVTYYRWLGTVSPGHPLVILGSVTSSTYYSGIGGFSIQLSSPSGLFSAPTLDFTVTNPTVTVPRFTDIAAGAGVRDFNQVATDCTSGIGDNYISGSAWGDVNGDGWPDLYVPEQTGLAHLYINQKDGTFVDQAANYGVTNAGSVGIGATIVDYNNDGQEDIYVVNNGPNRLYRNNGGGSFTDVTAQAGVGQAGPGSGSSWGDFNNDGYVDLAVTNWGTCGQNGAPITYGGVFLYQNNGDGTFTDVTSLLARTGDVTGASFIATWFDYNHDGLIDLYLGNDYLGPAPRSNLLWRNDGFDSGSGKWSFTNVSVVTGTKLTINDMGTAVGDYNRDGTMDLALSNIQYNQLLINAPLGTYSNVMGGAGTTSFPELTSQKSVTWGVQFSDFNLDGWPDLYFPMGSLRRDSSNPDPMANQTFVNHKGTFLDLSAPSHANDPAISRGMSLTDFNRDGLPDMFVANQDGYPDLYQNTTTTSGHWLELTLVGTKSNRDACGAWVTAKISRKVKLVREVFCGSVGVGSGNWKVLHFGLGRATNIASLTIQWPSGTKQVIQNQAVDRFKTIVEP